MADMKTIEKQIQEARPPLKIVSPLTYLIIMGFAVGNIFLAPAFLVVPLHALVVFPTIYAKWFWFAGFEFLAIGLLWGLRQNNWRLLRRLLAAGLTLKSIIMFALVVNMFQHGISGYGTIILWAMLSYFQAAVLIHPIPVMGVSAKQQNEDSDYHGGSK
jgi:hypothetical protein